MMNMQNLDLKDRLGVKFKDSICDELCLKLWFESDWYFFNIIESWFFESGCPETKFESITSKSHFEKVTVQKPIAGLETVIFYQVISISFVISGSIKLVIIDMTHACMQSYPLSY